MAKKIENKTDIETINKAEETDNNNQLETMEIVLSNDVKVTVKEPTTPQVRRCRDLAKFPADVYMYLISECCLFDGKMLTPPAIEALRCRDYLLIEGCIRELVGEKN